MRAELTVTKALSARITPERFEQELFGEEAEGKLVRAGLLEMADGGTLYLDEVADMPLNTQARILRVLTEQKFVRVGGNRQIGVDVRVVSSTARELEKEIAEKRFREDLRIQIRRFSGNISKTAGFIGMERSALHRKLKLLGMSDRDDPFERE